MRYIFTYIYQISSGYIVCHCVLILLDDESVK